MNETIYKLNCHEIAFNSHSMTLVVPVIYISLSVSRMNSCEGFHLSDLKPFSWTATLCYEGDIPSRVDKHVLQPSFVQGV